MCLEGVMSILSTVEIKIGLFQVCFKNIIRYTANSCNLWYIQGVSEISAIHQRANRIGKINQFS